MALPKEGFGEIGRGIINLIRDIVRRYDIPDRASYRDAYLYRPSGESQKSPFDILLTYSTQKPVDAFIIAFLIAQLNNSEKLDILDIGSSKGTLFGMTSGLLLELGFRRSINFTLLEPDAYSTQTLQVYADAMRDSSSGKFSSTVVQEGWEEFRPGKYDGIICSHMIYHLAPSQFPELFKKMIDSLNSGGKLLLVARAREQNQVYQFIERYKTLVPNETFNDITIQNALPVLEALVSSDTGLSMRTQTLPAQVTLPLYSNPEDAHTLVAFFLQRPTWSDLPEIIQDQITQDYGGRDITLYQPDRLVEITRT